MLQIVGKPLSLISDISTLKYEYFPHTFIKGLS